jgi:hypothetical protein
MSMTVFIVLADNHIHGVFSDHGDAAQEALTIAAEGFKVVLSEWDVKLPTENECGAV